MSMSECSTMKLITLPSGKRILPLCINLQRSKDRKDNIDRMFCERNIAVNFVKAFDKNLLVDENTGNQIETTKVLCGYADFVEGVINPTKIICLDSEYKDRRFFYTPPAMLATKYKPYVHSLYLGAVGCALSHMECFRLFQQTEDADYLLVLEDDISIVGSSIDVFDAVIEHDFDLCLVGTSPQGQLMPSPNSSLVSDLLFEPQQRWYCGSSAYITTKKFVNNFSPFTEVCFAADEFFGFCQQDMGARLLAMKEPYFGLSSFAQETTNPTGV